MVIKSRSLSAFTSIQGLYVVGRLQLSGILKDNISNEKKIYCGSFVVVVIVNIAVVVVLVVVVVALLVVTDHIIFSCGQ